MLDSPPISEKTPRGFCLNSAGGVLFQFLNIDTPTPFLGAVFAAKGFAIFCLKKIYPV